MQSQLAFPVSTLQFSQGLNDRRRSNRFDCGSTERARLLQQANAGDPPATKWRETLETDVLSIASDSARRIHAVIDGAFFDNPPYLFSKHQLSARPLFGGSTPQDFVESGPWLIDLFHEPPKDTEYPSAPNASNPATQIRTLLKLVGDKPALVFWIGGIELTHEHLYRHLRSLNKVLVPKEVGDPDEVEAVLFRHADGNVLASVLPVLDEHQFSRLFGPALALVFHAPDHQAEDGSPIRRAVCRMGAEPGPVGMLALTPEQYAMLTMDRIRKNRRFTMDYLRDAAKDETADMRDGELYRFVCRAEKSGFSIGLESDYAHGLWAFMLISFGEQIAENAQVTDSIRNSDDPDTALEDLMNELAESGADEDLV